LCTVYITIDDCKLDSAQYEKDITFTGTPNTAPYFDSAVTDQTVTCYSSGLDVTVPTQSDDEGDAVEVISITLDGTEYTTYSLWVSWDDGASVITFNPQDNILANTYAVIVTIEDDNSSGAYNG
jgi:hypothetical protein